MHRSRREQAARNNALWCDTVCRAHGAAGVFLETAWINKGPSPLYYPNLVTTGEADDPEEALAAIRGLLDQPRAAPWAVKDSFCGLALETSGFALLFEATWIWCEPPTGGSASADLNWRPLTSPSALAEWEAGWWLADGGIGPHPRQFPPSLLDDPELVFLGLYDGAQLVAGGILNQTEGVVGVSNVFAPTGRETAAWQALMAGARAVFPGRPLVGYEQPGNLAPALACGFEAVGPLRVWLRPA